MPIQRVIDDIEAARSEALLIAGPVTPPPPPPPPPDPPPTGPEDWKRLGTGGSAGAYFRRPAMLPNGDIWAAWDRSYIFSRTGKAWMDTAPVGQSGALYDIGRRENYGAWCDGSKVRIGNGGPVGYGYPPALPPYPQWGDISFDLTARTYALDRDAPNSLGQGDDAYLARNGVIYCFGGWTIGKQNTIRLEGASRVNVTGPNPPTWTQEQAKLTYSRAGIDSRDGSLWTLADNYALHTHDGTATGKWVAVPTTGTKPPAYGSATLDEERNRIVVWIGGNHIVEAGHDVDVCETHVLDLTTRAWSKLALATKPPATPQCQHNLLFNPITRACNLVIDTDSGTDVWELSGGGGTTNPPPLPPPVDPLPPPPVTPAAPGLIASRALPNIVGAPFRLGSGCKHVNMCFSSLTGRVWISGGDFGKGSAQDGTWSLDPDNPTDQRLEIGEPSWPSLVAPHAAQDGMGFIELVSGELYFHPGAGYFGYDVPFDPAVHPVVNWSKGSWFCDTIAKTWRQDLRMYPKFGSGYHSNVNGGVYDPLLKRILVLLDNSFGGPAILPFDITFGTWGTQVPFTVPKPIGFPAHSGVVFTQSRPCVIGRFGYFVGYSHDGSGQASQIARAWRVNLDTLQVSEIARPPIAGSQLDIREMRLAESNGKVVWIVTPTTQGTVVAVVVYSPALDTWYEDMQSRGAEFMGNSMTTIPVTGTNRTAVALCGGSVFDPGDRAPTHFNTYEAA